MKRRWGCFVYYVQNGKAKDLADVLKQIFTPPEENDPFLHNDDHSFNPSWRHSVHSGKAERQAHSCANRARSPSSTPWRRGGGIPTGEINIVVDETTNALIIRAYPRDYRFVLETVKKLDLYPKQVLIEVFLAEITLDDTNKFGAGVFESSQDTFTKGGDLV